MGRVLIIGAGGVGTVVAHKVAQNADVFTDIMIASRTKEKCDKIVEAISKIRAISGKNEDFPNFHKTILKNSP